MGESLSNVELLSSSRRQLIADLALLLVTVIWGSTFVMVKDAVAGYPVFSFLAVRFGFAALALLPLVLSRRVRRHASAGAGEPGKLARASRRPLLRAESRGGGDDLMGASAPWQQHERGAPEDVLAAGIGEGEPLPVSAVSSVSHVATPSSRDLVTPVPPLQRSAASLHPLAGSGLRGAVSCSLAPLLPPILIGMALFSGYGFQTSGLQLSTPAKTGFITGLSVVIVPVVAALLLRQRPGRMAWVGVTLATAGLAFLSWQPGEGVSLGDVLVFGCALSFTAHILLTGRFAARLDPLWLTFGQIVTVAVLSGATGLAFEVRPALTPAVLFAAAFTGLLATSAAFGVQTMAQRFTTTTHTALIFSAEPVFAALFSFLLIGEALGPRQLLGGSLILAGMLAAEFKREGTKGDA